MELHVGLDVALESTSVCIVDATGGKLLETTAASEPEALCLAIRPHVAAIERIGIEASALGMWLARELKAEGLPVTVVEARHMRSALSAMRNKTDRNDAHGIAQMMRTGWFRAVHIKPPETQRLKTFLANRRLLKRKLIEDHDDYLFRTMIESMLEVRGVLYDNFRKLHRMLLLIVKHDAVCRRLMTVPGVGPVAALSFRVTIDDPRRFARSRTVGAHLGLTPRRYQSGSSVDWGGRISRMGDIDTRAALCEAAASLLLRVKRYSALKAWGMRIARRSGMMCAIVAVARKLATILHRMWLDETEFSWKSGAKVTEKRPRDPATGRLLPC